MTQKQTREFVGDSSGTGAELVDLGSTDWTPTQQNPSGHAMPYTRALILGTAGDVKVDMADGGAQAVILPSLPAGYNPIRVTKIYKTGTAATLITALY